MKNSNFSGCVFKVRQYMMDLTTAKSGFG